MFILFPPLTLVLPLALNTLIWIWTCPSLIESRFLWRWSIGRTWGKKWQPSLDLTIHGYGPFSVGSYCFSGQHCVAMRGLSVQSCKYRGCVFVWVFIGPFELRLPDVVGIQLHLPVHVFLHLPPTNKRLLLIVHPAAACFQYSIASLAGFLPSKMAPVQIPCSVLTKLTRNPGLLAKPNSGKSGCSPTSTSLHPVTTQFSPL